MSTVKLNLVRALVVDDDPDIREFVCGLLESAGCDDHLPAGNGGRENAQTAR